VDDDGVDEVDDGVDEVDDDGVDEVDEDGFEEVVVDVVVATKKFTESPLEGPDSGDMAE